MIRTLFLRMLAFLIAVVVVLGTLAPDIKASTALQTQVALSAGASNVPLASSLRSGYAVPEGPDGGGIKAGPAYTVTLGAWRNLRPTESYLRGVSLLPSSYSVACNLTDQQSKGWIVGDDGVILSYCNGLWEHAIIVESVPTSLFGVQAISPTLAVAVGEQGAVLMYLYDPIAQNWVWTKSPIPVGNQLLYNVSMAPLNDGTGRYVGWAVGDKDASGRGTLVYGTITPKVLSDGHVSYDYTWENKTSSFSNLPQADLYFHVQMLAWNDGWAVGGTDGPNGQGVILHWNGIQWSVSQLVGTNLLLGLKMRSASDGWAVGSGGVIYHFNGVAWTKVDSPTTGALTNVDFAPTGEGWAVGFGGILIRYDGGTWSTTQITRSDPFDYWGLDFTSGHGWLVGFHASRSIGGHMLEYDNGEWWSVTPPTDNRLNAVGIVSDNDAWAVGTADSAGGTILRWDGKHWQRWYQHDLPIPAVDLYALDMTSSTDGWAAGDPPTPGAPAVFLHWDGHRWSPPRYASPVNVRVNDISMLDQNFGWAVADTGNAVAKYDGATGFWSGNHTCDGIYYQLLSSTVFSDTNVFGWDAWAVSTNNPIAYFLRFKSGCGGSNAWQVVGSPVACRPKNPGDPWPTDGGTATLLRGIQMRPATSGYAVGSYRSRAVIHSYDNLLGWQYYLCEAEDSPNNPSQYNSIDMVKNSDATWIGGYYTDRTAGRKVAYIVYIDSGGPAWGNRPYPRVGRNIYHRPIQDLRMSSDTMGWAVGDSEDPTKLSVIYQYPYPNFTLNALPSARAILPGGSTSYTATVNSLGGFDANVALAVQGIAPGITYSVIPPNINSQQVATIYITAPVTTPLGLYNISLQGVATFPSGDRSVTVVRTVPMRLTVTNHPLYSVSPERGPAGTMVTMLGTNFGADPGTGNRSSITSTQRITLAGQLMPDANVLSWSNTQISVLVPDNPALFPHGAQLGEASIMSQGVTSNQDFTYQIENHLTGVTTQMSGSLITVTLSGTGLGNDPGSLFRSTTFEHVTLSGSWIPNTSVIAWGNNSIAFTVPASTAGGLLSVTSNGYESNAVTFEAGGYKVYLPIIQK